MVEIKTSGIKNRLGFFRANYLDLAQRYYATARSMDDYITAARFLEGIEFSLEPGSEAKKECTMKLNLIEEERKEKTRQWELKQERLTILEKYDSQNQRELIEIEMLGKAIQMYRELSSRYGLLEE